ncbi:MAG: hypothetical protein JEY97_12945 [Bacteroidales bacterium]|nr:hypothetical protein [Bacteroidales bacterium]
MKKLIMIFTVLILNSYIVNSQDYWEIIDTPPGIDLHSIDVNSNGDMFIGVGLSTGGGVLRNLNNLNTWDTSLYFNNDVIGKIYIDKYNNVFAASDHLYYSDNNGDSWTQIYFEQGFGITSILRNSDNLIFFGKWGGIFKYDSIGSNWVQVLSLGNTEVVNAIIEDTITGSLYAGTTKYTGNGGGIYQSEDGGNIWEHIGLINQNVSSLALNSSGDLFAGTRNFIGGVFVLPAGSDVWTNLNNIELVTSIVINSENSIYIGCSNLDGYTGGVRQSVNNGQTWEIINTGMGDKDIENLKIGADGHLFAVAYNSPIPLFKSVNSTLPITPQPSNYPENFSAHNIELQWTDPEEGILPHAYLILMSDISFEAIKTPVDNVAILDGHKAKNITYGVEKCVFSNLAPGTEYYFRIFPYTYNSYSINYKNEEEAIQTMKRTKE